jgi:DNA mismatch repair protein MutL
VGRVRVLPEVLAHQIAAGEIVERPASVVKELVENALDAEASSVRVYLEEGGKRVIRVTDDGYGMTAEDATLAFEHHATSKIAQVEDLQQIRTLGFRGEALPSIASVSRTILKTVDRDSSDSAAAPGIEIEYEGGRRSRMLEIAWPGGTEITVRELFYNVPARRKFLKTSATELSHVSRLLTCYALAFPGIEFRLDHESRNILDAFSVDKGRERVFQLFGERLVEALAPLDYAAGTIRISGFASLPHEQRNSSQSLYLFVNRRMVRDRLLTHAVRQAYQNLIPAAAYPVVILFLEIDPALVDVNVHPTKAEIRFRNSSEVHSAVLRAVEQSLLLHRSNLSSLARDVDFARTDPVGHDHRTRDSLDAFLSRTSTSPLFRSYEGAAVGRTGSGSRLPGRLDDDSQVWGTGTVGEATNDDPHGSEIPHTDNLSPATVVLGQFVESFIVATDRSGVMLVDQHVAHERILYDRALRALGGTATVPVQRLLIAETVDLEPAQVAVVSQVLDYLNQNGFEVEWFGERTLIVRGVPALTGSIDAKKLLGQLFDELDKLDELRLDGPDADRGLRRLREKIAISLSCRAAVKINTPLSAEKMRWLIDELFRCENPYTCPHGRPIVLRLNLEEVLRGFKRI